MKHTVENLHQLWPLRKPTTFRYLPQIALVPFKTRMIRFPDNHLVFVSPLGTIWVIPANLKWPEVTLSHEALNDLYVWPRVKSDVSIYIQADRLAMMFMLTQTLSIMLETYSMWQGFVTNMTQLHFVTRSPTLSQLCFCLTILNLDSKLCQNECFIEWCYFGIWLWLNRHTEYELRVLVRATELLWI